MTATNQNQENDSLVVVENDDGSFTIMWDDQDPKYQYLNDLTEEEVAAMIIGYCKDYLSAHQNDEQSLGNNE